MLNLSLTDPHDENLFIKCGIEKCHIKHLSLGMYASINRPCIFIVSNQYDVTEFASPLVLYCIVFKHLYSASSSLTM